MAAAPPAARRRGRVVGCIGWFLGTRTPVPTSRRRRSRRISTRGSGVSSRGPKRHRAPGGIGTFNELFWSDAFPWARGRSRQARAPRGRVGRPSRPPRSALRVRRHRAEARARGTHAGRSGGDRVEPVSAPPHQGDVAPLRRVGHARSGRARGTLRRPLERCREQARTITAYGAYVRHLGPDAAALRDWREIPPVPRPRSSPTISLEPVRVGTGAVRDERNHHLPAGRVRLARTSLRSVPARVVPPTSTARRSHDAGRRVWACAGRRRLLALVHVRSWCRGWPGRCSDRGRRQSTGISPTGRSGGRRGGMLILVLGTTLPGRAASLLACPGASRFHRGRASWTRRGQGLRAEFARRNRRTLSDRWASPRLIW